MGTIIQLCRLAYATGTLVADQARALYGRLVAVMILAIVVVFIGWVANLAGYRGACIFLSLILTMATAIFWMDPIRLAVIAGTGAIVGALPRVPGNPVTMGGKFLSVYVDVLGKVLLWGAIFLFILGTVPFGEKPTVIFTLTAGVILLVLMDWQWHFSAKMSRKLIYTFVVGTMIASGLMLIPGAVWVKYLHWDPESAKTSSTAEKLYVLDKAMRDTADEDRAKELDRITDKVTKRKALTAEEKAFVAGARKAGPGEQAAPKAPVTTASPTRGLPNDATDLPRAWNPDGSMTDVTTWPYVNAPHGKDTVMVPTMIGYHIVWDGIGITVYCRYADNHTEVEPCTEGPQVGQYAHNNGQSDVKASYAFAKKGEK